MKKLQLYIVLLMCATIFAQPKISPYFPQNPEQSGRYQTQFTFYDLNFVSLRVQDYLDRNMGMSLKDTKFNLKNGVGSIDFIYEEAIVIGTNSQPQKMHVIYEVEAIDNEFVIKSCTINGSAYKVEAFYVGFWKTSLQFNEVKSKGIVYNYYLQDKISYSLTMGKPTIKITSTSIKDFQKFKSEFSVKKKADDSNKEMAIADSIETKKVQDQKNLIEAQINEEKQLEKDKEKEKRANTKVTYGNIMVVKKKEQYKTSDDVSDSLMSAIKEYLSLKEDGEYGLKTATTFEYNNEIKNEVSGYSFKRLPNAGNQILKRLTF
jgi:hypothetical protein